MELLILTKPSHGGAREGSGAPKKEHKKITLSVRLLPEIIEQIPGMKSRFIEAAVVAALELRK